jgi:hypothetical protein
MSWPPATRPRHEKQGESHRRDRTIGEYLAAILDRQVHDHRVVRAVPAAEGDAA